MADLRPRRWRCQRVAMKRRFIEEHGLVIMRNHDFT
jgi:hypothetical protein